MWDSSLDFEGCKTGDNAISFWKQEDCGLEFSYWRRRTLQAICLNLLPRVDNEAKLLLQICIVAPVCGTNFERPCDPDTRQLFSSEMLS